MAVHETHLYKCFQYEIKVIELSIDDHYLEDLYLGAFNDDVRRMILSL